MQWFPNRGPRFIKKDNQLKIAQPLIRKKKNGQNTNLCETEYIHMLSSLTVLHIANQEIIVAIYSLECTSIRAVLK